MCSGVSVFQDVLSPSSLLCKSEGRMHECAQHTSTQSVPAAATDEGPESPRLCSDAGPAPRVFFDDFSRVVPEAGWAMSRTKIREGLGGS